MDKRDLIDDFDEEWARVRPDLVTDHVLVLGRILRIRDLAMKASERWLAPHGITWDMFDMIATLRRTGPPFALNPSSLSRALLLSSGAMTMRIDRVEKRGLVRREPDPGDRRGTLVVLTEQGLELADAVLTAHFKEANQLLDCLSATERALVAKSLRKILLQLEDPAGQGPGNGG